MRKTKIILAIFLKIVSQVIWNVKFPLVIWALRLLAQLAVTSYYTSWYYGEERSFYSCQKTKAILDITNKFYGGSLFQFTEMGSTVNKISFKLICCLTLTAPQSWKMGGNVSPLYSIRKCAAEPALLPGFVNNAKISFRSVCFEGSIHGSFEIKLRGE